MMASEMVAAIVAAMMAEAEWHVNGRRVRIGVRIKTVWIASITAVRMMPMTISAYMNLLQSFFAHSKSTGYRTASDRQSSGRIRVAQAS
jgi:hypothetical protein